MLLCSLLVVEMQYLHNSILMNVRYICSSKVLIIASSGWSLKFTEMSCLHSLCTKILGSITLKKLLSHILPAASEHARNNPIYSLVKRRLTDLLLTGSPSSLIFPLFHSKTHKMISFLWSSAMTLYLSTPRSTSPFDWTLPSRWYENVFMTTLFWQVSIKKHSIFALNRKIKLYEAQWQGLAHRL